MKNLFLYFSAFIPMYALLLLKFIIELINGNIHFTVLNTIILILLSALIILGVIGLLWNIKWNREKAVEVIITKKQNITDQHFFGYFSLFVLFALGFELTKISMFVVSLLILIFIGLVYVNNKLFYVNPLLNIMGFNFYEITYKIVGSEEERRAKMFFKGTLILDNKPCKIKLKNENFSFIEHSHY